MSPVVSEPRTIAFALPPLDGPVTGGTRYNQELLRALEALGRAPERLNLHEAAEAVGHSRPRLLWVDSLWMHSIPALCRRASARCRVGLWMHWLPTLVSHGERPPAEALSTEEAAALALAHAFIAPSEYLADELRALGVAPTSVHVLEPGTELPTPPRPAKPRPAVRALTVANLLVGKGILPLLEALARHLRSDDALELTVLGSLEMDPQYARRCIELVQQHPALRERVTLGGPRPYDQCVEALLKADLVLSASRMESYGMALADARAGGRPILARAGGNAAHHVDPRWGGQRVPDAEHLARAALALVRDRDELRERQRRAWTHRMERPWAVVAAEFVALCEGWPP